MQMTASSKEALLLGALAHIHALLEDAGVGVRHGIVLYIGDNGKTNKVLEDLRRYGILEHSLLGKEKPEFPNYRMAVVPFLRSYTLEKLQNYLGQRGFIPAIIVGGALPAYFWEQNVLLLSPVGDIQEKEDDSLGFEGFKDFAHQNPGFVQQCISAFITSARFKKIREEPGIRISLEATAYVLANFYRQQHDEEETLDFLKVLWGHVERMCQEGFGGYDDANVSLAVSNCLSDYIAASSAVGFFRLGKKEEEWKWQEGETGILYDNEFYYLTDRVLRLACKPLLDSVSYLAVKAALHQEGTLVCGQAGGAGYTVKRLLHGQDGKMARVRVVKLRRAALEGSGGLTLIERRQLHVPGEMRGQRLQGGENGTKQVGRNHRDFGVRKDLQDGADGTGEGKGKAYRPYPRHKPDACGKGNFPGHPR